MTQQRSELPYMAEAAQAIKGRKGEAVGGNAEHNGWNVESLWRAVGGRAEAVELRIKHDDGRPVTAGAIRRLPLGEMLAATRTAVDQRAESTIRRRKRFPDIEDAPFDWNAFRATGPQRGRPLSDERLAAIASVYRTAWRKNHPVTNAVAKKFKVSNSTASKQIMAARAAGLLDGVGPQR